MKALDEVRSSVEHGTLRGLAEKQSLSSPRLVEHLRRHQALMCEREGNLASHQPATTEFPCYSPGALVDPLVEDWERFMTQGYEAPEKVRDVMIFLPVRLESPIACRNLMVSSFVPSPRLDVMRS